MVARARTGAGKSFRSKTNQQSTKIKNKQPFLAGSSLEPNKIQMYLPATQGSHSQDKAYLGSSTQPNYPELGGNGMQI